MFKVKVESLLDNIVIIDNELYFYSEAEDIYLEVPFNKYYFDSDSFNAVQVFLYHEDYLGFCYTGNIFNFRNECLKQLSEGNTSFKYNGLSVIIEEVEDPEEINIVKC